MAQNSPQQAHQTRPAAPERFSRARIRQAMEGDRVCGTCAHLGLRQTCLEAMARSGGIGVVDAVADGDACPQWAHHAAQGSMAGQGAHDAA